MKHFATLLLKEEKAIFSSPIAYATVAVYLILMGYTFTAVLFLNRTGELVRVFFQAAVLFLLVVPVVTMRLFAEERRGGTLELLLTSPVREIEIVLDPEKLAAAGLSVTDVAQALRAQNQLEPVGRFAEAGQQHLALASGLWKTPDDIAAAPVLVGMMFTPAARARRASLCGASSTFWSFVYACTVVR